MRQIKPLDISGINPADLSGLKQPDFDLVDPRELWVEDEAQREFGPKQKVNALRIVTDFRWPHFTVVSCVRVDGKLFVINGQTTAIACASHPDIKVIPIIIVDAPELEERARAFVSHSRDHVAATPGQIWKGLVTAGDEQAVQTRNVCLRAAVDLVPFPPQGAAYKPGQTIALAAIQKLIARRGPERAVEVLRALAQAELAPITADWIKASDTLLNDDEYRVEMDGERLTATIKALGPRAYADMREIAAAKHLPAWKALIAVAFKNRVKRTKAAQNQAPALSSTHSDSEAMGSEAADPSPMLAPRPNGRFYPGEHPRYGR